MVYLLLKYTKKAYKIMKDEKIFITNNLRETQKIAEDIAQQLKGGEIIALHGELGSGKTTFAQGLAKGLGITKRIISPTFIIMRTYKTGSKNFYHIDLYRVESQNDIEGLGIKEILADKNVIVAIEWAEKIQTLLPQERIDMRLEYVSESKRRIVINGKS